MATKKKPNVFGGLNLDLDMDLDIVQGWAAAGFDAEEYCIPAVNAEDYNMTEDAEDDTRYIKPRIGLIKYAGIRYENAQCLAEQLPLMEEGERYDLVCGGRFVFGDFIEAYLIRHRIRVKRMVISTLSLSENNVDSLRTLMECGCIDRLDIIVSAYFYSHEKHQLIPYMYRELDIDNRFQLAVANIHTKTYQWETLGGHKMIMQGSANMRSSANLENMLLECNSEVYDFYLELYDDILAKSYTIEKQCKNLKTWYKMDAADKDVKVQRKTRKKSED